MIFKTFFLKRSFILLFAKATKAIYSEQFDFPELLNHLSNKNNNFNLLKTYIVIQIITERVLPVDKISVEYALDSYIKSEKKLSNSIESELVLSYNEAKAEKGFLEAMTYFTYGNLAFEENEYSYEGLKYKIKKVKKGPLTIEEHEKFKALSEQIIEVDNNLNGKRTKEELDKEYEDLIKALKKTIK